MPATGRNQMKLVQKRDLILAAAILLIAAAAVGINHFIRRAPAAIAQVSVDGVLVLVDLGSAVMTTEMVIEMFEGKKVEMVDCPLVEGAVVATIDSVGGMSFEDIKTALAGVGTAKKF